MLNVDELIKNGANIRFDMKLEDLKYLGKEIVKEYIETVQKQDPQEQECKYVNVDKVCEKLDISRTTLWSLDRKGITKPIRLGNIKRYRLSDIEELGQIRSKI